MKWTNTQTHFGIISILLHWVMAFIIIGLLAVGLYMTSIAFSPFKLELFRWHKEYGLLVLLLVMLRLAWRLTNTTPELAELPMLERLAARSTHWVLYLVLFVQPISGWLLTSSSGVPVSFFGLFVMPDLVSPNEHLRHALGFFHQCVAYFLIAVLCLHIAAALKHHFINKDAILRRMLWP